MKWTVKDILEICNGTLYSGDININCENFSKDTRTINSGDVYVGIKGEQFDGNSFYAKAFENGASLCIIEKSYVNELLSTDKTIILVEDSIETLKKLAIAKLDKHKPKVIAVTGSVGKTGTRDIIYSIVSKKYKTLVTEKNYNNNIGLPLTILKLKDEEIVLLEMGMNHPGEIEYLSQIAKPDIAVITNVLPVHIEYLGSIENILKAKLEIVSGLKKDGVLIVNNDDENLNKVNLDDVKIITCGVINNSDYMAKMIDKYKFEVNINENKFCFDNRIGTKGYLLNSLLAIAVGLKLGVEISDIQKALNEYKLTSGRLEKIKSKKGSIIINDAYNASTSSMNNAIEYLLNESGKRKIAILGDMNELGEQAKELHENVGKFIAKNPVDYLITIGSYAKYISETAKTGMLEANIKHFSTKDESKLFLKELINSEDVIIVKASNGNKFSEIVEYIKDFC